MFITIAKAYGNEINDVEVGPISSNKQNLKPASFSNIASMLGGSN